MTNEEAIKVLRTESVEIGGNAVSVCRFWEALDMAISALRQQECVGDVNKSLTIDELSERNAPVFYQSKIFRMVGIGVFAKTDTSFLQVDTDLWQKRDQTGCFTARSRRRMAMNNIPRNTEASMYWAWFKKEYPELFKCDISETVESCEECGFCEAKAEKETLNEQGCRH